MPRDRKLSSRLETLLDAIFEPHADRFGLYWEIAAELEPRANPAVQKKIRRSLEGREGTGANAAVLVAAVLHLTGFPPQRVLHFLSLYVPSTVSLAQFEFAVTALFMGDPPVPQSVLYDLTQYTYLEKRLMIRKGLDISERLKGSLGPDVLLYLYLLSLRDDLSNENVQLITLVMKNCFPAQDVRNRLGAVSLEEYGELARAWKTASQRSLSDETLRGNRTPEPPPRAFDRDSASHFLDKYFSDEALAQTHARVVKPLPRSTGPASLASAPETGRRLDGDGRVTGTRTRKPAAAEQKPSSTRATAAVTERGRRARSAGAPAARRPAPRELTGSAPGREPGPRSAAVEAAAAPSRRGRAAGLEDVDVGADAPASSPARTPRASRRHRAAKIDVGPMRLVFVVVPFCVAVLAGAVVPILESRPAWHVTAPSAQAPAPATAATPAVPSAPTPAAPAAPPVTKYVVRPGDSVWKIYHSLGRQPGGGADWQRFLSTTRALNGLDDPDTILPGRVLDITPDK
jgi:nucleoid-associated protein YgaU